MRVGTCKNLPQNFWVIVYDVPILQYQEPLKNWHERLPQRSFWIHVLTTEEMTNECNNCHPTLRVETKLKAIKEIQVRPKSSLVFQKRVHRTGEHTCFLSILMLAVGPHQAWIVTERVNADLDIFKYFYVSLEYDFFKVASGTVLFQGSMNAAWGLEYLCILFPEDRDHTWCIWIGMISLTHHS